MIRNFSIFDAVLFDISGDVIDFRSDCDLTLVNFRPGSAASVEMQWIMIGTNYHISISFRDVADFIVTSGNPIYPPQSGSQLKIAGFTDGGKHPDIRELSVEPTEEAQYLTFVMDNEAAILVKSPAAMIKRIFI